MVTNFLLVMLQEHSEHIKDDTLTSRNKEAHSPDFKIPIVYSDEELIIIDKPFDLCLAGDFKYSVKNLMETHYNDLIKNGVGRNRMLRICHTLDYETSGLLCMASTQNGARALSKAFSGHHINKYYLSIVYGRVDTKMVNEKLKTTKVDDDIIRIKTYISNDSNKLYSTPLKQFAPGEQGYLAGKEATSCMQVLAYGTYKSLPCTLLIMKLLSGRRHQLRLHAKFIGHPIVGDTIYADAPEDSYLADRMMLHSYFMRIQLQATTKNFKKNEILEVKASDPFSSLLADKEQVKSIEEVLQSGIS